MSWFDSIIGNNKKDSNPQAIVGNDPYGQMSQSIDPSIIPLMNAPATANAQIAQFATESKEIIENFRDGLRGYRIVKRYNVDTRREEIVKEVFGSPVMNEKGVNELCRELELYLSKTYILSNIPTEDRKRVDAMLRIIWKSINHKLIVNAVQYELDKTRRPGVVHEMVFIIERNTMRSYQDGERGKFYGSQRTVQTISQTGSITSAPTEKKGLFGF